ncbi:hypothetical protein [Planomonospora sphaerica]|uniref:hypothetical protein n=1 Tax=Planomonospora sphaerica TaxID=161355 RepID=UPI0012F8BC1A|nr:hypothetical protein [Planomonospora sphaerica]
MAGGAGEEGGIGDEVGEGGGPVVVTVTVGRGEAAWAGCSGRSSRPGSGSITSGAGDG